MRDANTAKTAAVKQESDKDINVRSRSGREGKIRVLMADDHAIISEAFNLILQNAGMEVVGTAVTGEEAVSMAQELEPDIVLLDVVMPEMDGLAALAILRYMRPEMLIFMLTSFSDKLYLARAGELGANGFFSKSVDPDILIEALYDAMENGAAFLSPPAPDQPRRPTQPGFPIPEEQRDLGVELTDQEMLVLSLLALGYDNNGITAQLHISINTLKTHLRNIYEKIDVNDRTQAVIWAIRNGIAPIV